MTVKFQITIDCADPDRLARFWAEALSYQIAPPPTGFDSWADWYRSVGVPDDELVGLGVDRLVDPDGHGPKFWFQQVPEGKAVKNRIHFDLIVSRGRESTKQQRKVAVDAAADRLVALGASRFRVLDEEGFDHYAIVMQDPEGNEFCLA